MSEKHMDMLQGSITQRQYELHRIADILAKAAHEESKRASTAKVLLIVLGAFTATKGAADQIFEVDPKAWTKDRGQISYSSRSQIHCYY
ncbi:hypothetical protein H6F89_00155 [Cyanobacteria bacterium FACHB-63]|nr:hypothetical protein [Cyanobacteria bacterium FACHB-63]